MFGADIDFQILLIGGWVNLLNPQSQKANCLPKLRTSRKDRLGAEDVTQR